MAVFRVERNTGYTVMSNHHLRNKELSLKAKGLLSQMLSLPEDWDYTLAGLSHINREKIDAIREAVKELEKAGYIVRSRERDEKGRLRGADYVIYEQPQPKEPEAATSSEQPPTSDLPTLENPTLDNPTLEKPTLENPTQLNKDISSKEQSITDLSSTHSIPFHSLNPLPYEQDEAATPPERKRTEAKTNSAIEIYREIIKDNIDYDILIQDPKMDKDRLDEIVEIMLETVCTARKTIRIAGDDYPAELVKSKFMKLNIRSEKDVLKVVNTLIVNTKGEGEKSAEDFWVKAERLLYCALIGYIWYEAPAEEMNFTTLLELINASEAREDDEEYQSPVDLLFADLEERSPDHFAVKQYKKYKLAAGKTAKSILISCGARLAPFDIEELRELMSYDELELDTLGDRKTALFLIMSDTDDTFNFVIAILQSQLFNLLCDKADDEYNGKLPIHVRFLLDEFANIGQIPRFDKLIATIRSREMSASIILQSQSQLKAIYKDAAEIILDNADSTLFLGGRGKNAKDISDNLGRETIDSFNTSENRGTQVSHGLTYQKLGKELMTQDEIAVMDGGKCILQLRGVRPFLSDKYDITKHPNYKYLSDFDKRNAFDVERYMSTRPAIVKPDEAFDIYEIDLSDEDAAAEE
jgi:type IV secretion system protein VirD4